MTSMRVSGTFAGIGSHRCVLERPGHRRAPLLHQAIHQPGDVVREQIGNPDDAGTRVANGEDLDRRVMMREPSSDRGVRKPARAIVDIHDQLAHDGSVRERHDPGVPIELRIEDEALRKTRVDFADVANRVPDAIGRCVDDDFFVNRSHAFLLLPCDEVRPRLGSCQP